MLCLFIREKKRTNNARCVRDKKCTKNVQIMCSFLEPLSVVVKYLAWFLPNQKVSKSPSLFRWDRGAQRVRSEKLCPLSKPHSNDSLRSFWFFLLEFGENRI